MEILSLLSSSPIRLLFTSSPPHLLSTKVSMAIPKTKMEEEVLGKRSGGKDHYSYYYEQYWADQVEHLYF